MKRFTDLDEAIAAYVELEKAKETVDGELTAEKKAHGITQKSLEGEKLAHDKTKADLETEKGDHAETQKLAKDAIDQLNETPEDKSKVTATVDGGKYEVVFGVDGLTKEELAKDTKKLKVMIANGSAAIVKMEGK